MKRFNFKSLLIAAPCGFCAFAAFSASSLFSDYGQIQNVQNYSSNPFWSPNAPYNQRLPQPVYVQGADLNTEDCNRVVQSLISVQCMARDNCAKTTLAEIRPTIMVQLSNLPGNNYVSACSGYIDGIFESYVAQYGNTIPNKTVSFPNATVANQNLGATNTLTIKNPYKQVTTKRQREIDERSAELQQLQQQNGSGNEHLETTVFPKTYADLSFSERVANTAEGYAPFKDKKAYNTIKVLNDDEWCDEHPNSKECQTYKEKTKNCTDIARASDSKVTRAEYENKICIIKGCIAGYRPGAGGKACVLSNGTDCMNQINDDNAVAAEIDANGKCKIIDCKPSFHPNTSGTKCIKNGSADQDENKIDCTDNFAPSDNVKKAEIDENGKCKIIECKDVWDLNETGDKCDKINTNKDCTNEIAHAKEATYTMLGCTVKECEQGYVPINNNKRCAEEYYYTMEIYQKIIDWDKLKYFSNDKASNLCYSVCGIHAGGDDVNKKVLQPVLQDNNVYCVFKGTSSIKSSFMLTNISNSNKIRFNSTQVNQIINNLESIKDTGECDGFNDDIYAEILRCETMTDQCIQYHLVILDD